MTSQVLYHVVNDKMIQYHKHIILFHHLTKQHFMHWSTVLIMCVGTTLHIIIHWMSSCHFTQYILSHSLQCIDPVFNRNNASKGMSRW